MKQSRANEPSNDGSERGPSQATVKASASRADGWPTASAWQALLSLADRYPSVRVRPC